MEKPRKKQLLTSSRSSGHVYRFTPFLLEANSQEAGTAAFCAWGREATGVGGSKWVAWLPLPQRFHMS